MSQFTKVSTQAIDDENLSCHARMVYVLLSRHADYSDLSEPIFAGIEYIASKLQISKSTVKKGLKQLVDHGYIRRESRYKQSANTYILK